MYLVDTNIWLERLLDQNRSDEVGQFLDRITPGQLLITDFSLHSIGVILTRLGRSDTLLCFLQDVLIDGGVRLASITPEEMPRLLPAIHDYGLDFDDAYQYLAAEKYSAVLISFDGDFDRTARGKKRPADIPTVP